MTLPEVGTIDLMCDPYAVVSSERAVDHARSLFLWDRRGNLTAAVTLDEFECTARGIEKALVREIQEIHADCSESDWDGTGASGITAQARDLATAFARAVARASAAAPEVAPAPNGCLLFEWRNQTEYLSVLVEKDGFLTFVLLGKNRRAKGRQRWSDKLPKILLTILDSFGEQ